MSHSFAELRRVPSLPSMHYLTIGLPSTSKLFTKKGTLRKKFKNLPVITLDIAKISSPVVGEPEKKLRKSLARA